MASDLRRDRGFTLIELVLAISILGIVVSAIAGASVVILRTTGPTSNRTDDARTLRGLTTWLAQDVASVPPGFDPSGERCQPSAGVTFLSLATSDPSGFTADYRFVVEDGAARIDRFTCVGGVTSQGSTITGSLSTTEPVVVTVAPAGITVGVEVTVEGSALDAAGDPNPIVVSAATRASP